VDVVYPIASDKKPTLREGYYHFTDLEDNKRKISYHKLKEKIESEYIIEKTFFLGTDRFGRDLLSRLLIGARISLSVGFISVFISLLIGVTLGSTAG
jgi:peptide/nickel transport system permease protein